MDFPSPPRNLNDIVLIVIIFSFYVIYHDYYEKIESTGEKIENLITNTNELEWEVDSLTSSSEIQTYSEQLSLIAESLKDSNAVKKLSLIASDRKAIDSLHRLETIALTKNAAATDKLRNFRSQNNLYNTELESAGNRIWYINIFVLFLVGLFAYYAVSVAHAESLNKDLIKFERYKNRIYTVCQSCAKQFSPILLHGKESNGTENKGFCKECYDNGQFKNPTLSAEDVINEFKSFNPKIKSEKVSNYVNGLVRWKKNPYVNIETRRI